uniref:Secreted protein n=1 Tax=Nelumbo nucifera TaxID=4432 RepID=A0A822YX59_NELNU|nr:TPA_asm: hypothetical protein HUJ06_007767 [Nelumbo nucifera]
MMGNLVLLLYVPRCASLSLSLPLSLIFDDPSFVPYKIAHICLYDVDEEEVECFFFFFFCRRIR